MRQNTKVQFNKEQQQTKTPSTNQHCSYLVGPTVLLWKTSLAFSISSLTTTSLRRTVRMDKFLMSGYKIHSTCTRKTQMAVLAGSSEKDKC